MGVHQPPRFFWWERRRISLQQRNPRRQRKPLRHGVGGRNLWLWRGWVRSRLADHSISNVAGSGPGRMARESEPKGKPSGTPEGAQRTLPAPSDRIGRPWSAIGQPPSADWHWENSIPAIHDVAQPGRSPTEAGSRPANISPSPSRSSGTVQNSPAFGYSY